MDVVLLGKLVAILGLVAGNAFFVGSEVAITAARRSKIKQMADMGDKRAKVVKLLHEEPTRFYAVTQIGITLVSMALGYIGMDAFKELMSPAFESMFGMFMPEEAAATWGGIVGLTMGFVIVSFLHVVGGELAPKVLAYHKAEALSCSLGWIINLLYVMWVPVIWLMNIASNWLLVAFGHGDIVGHGGGGHGHDSAAMSLDELSLVVNASTSSGSIDRNQGRMLMGVLDLSENTVEDAMVPKPDVRGLPVTATIGEALTLFSSSHHYSYPVFDGEKVVGTIFMKRLVDLFEKNRDNMANILAMPVGEILRPDPFIFPPTTKLSQAWKDFRDNRRQFGVVVNEHGSMTGIVTPADIVSRLVGQLPADEYSKKTDLVHKLKGSQWEIAGGVRVGDLEMLLNFPFPRETGYVTIGGLVFNRIGKVPEVGDVIKLENARIQILEINDLRIVKVLFQILAVDEQGTWSLADQESPADPA
ncbi:MAG: HlyC/CorC family transporter [Magnetococcales bacterium]|nr:HlyC/CorC family transporter [Magnetococcales bacterium]NGZ26509.1 HlyC/CorC family transporter [Magnetococcales bacterium]